MLKAESESLEAVRDEHFPRWLNKLCRDYIRKHGDDVGLPMVPYLRHVNLLNHVLKVNHACKGEPQSTLYLGGLFDHWGSIQGGKLWVTEPYMHSTMWPTLEAIADCLNLKFDFTDTSTHNPKPEHIGPRTVYCSRIAFQPKSFAFPGGLPCL